MIDRIANALIGTGWDPQAVYGKGGRVHEDISALIRSREAEEGIALATVVYGSGDKETPKGLLWKEQRKHLDAPVLIHPAAVLGSALLWLEHYGVESAWTPLSRLPSVESLTENRPASCPTFPLYSEYERWAADMPPGNTYLFEFKPNLVLVGCAPLIGSNALYFTHLTFEN